MKTPEFITVHTPHGKRILNTSEIASIEHRTDGSLIRMTVKNEDDKFVEYFTTKTVFINTNETD
ncbi:hypothetical protein [Draconibacterium halophilum]|uniref:Uncharacterized protein n=1 Tax=Draconibacterium halophilum TaxID=2706887 RepID=A0A6C0RE33_9BACT|nr:hypothetical protein [Draconibacterium halophilum]QIA08804.1 hypothetical protein G0Q07_14225 [Draconibacterium halophilum]